LSKSPLAAFADRLAIADLRARAPSGYTPRVIKTELLAGLTVALALVPEAVAFAFVAGVPALVGLYAAFIVGLITALFGGRPGMISGATGALAVVMVSLVGEHGIEYLFATVVLAGLIQIVVGAMKWGKFIRLVPHPVMLGFVNGLAIVIFLAQLTQFQPKPEPGAEVHGHGLNWAGPWLPFDQIGIMLALIALTMLIIWGLPKITKIIPAPLAGIGVVASLVIFAGIPTPTVGDLDSIAGGLPEFHVPVVPFSLETLQIILPYAVIIAAIGLIESLLTLNLVGEITGQRGGASRECLAQGAANTVTGFFGGMGGCAMIGQSMINVKSGGRTRLSGTSAALFLLVFILVGAPLIERIPLGALIGVMFMVVIGTFAWNSLRILTKVPRMDAFVIILVTAVTVRFDLATAVVVGVIVSALSFAWKSARDIHLVERDSISEPGAKVYEVHGALFFASTDNFAELFHPENDPETVIVDFAHSRVVDQSALQAIEDLAAKYKAAGKTIKLRHLTRDCHALLIRAGQLMVDSDDDPDYGLAVDYGVKVGSLGGGH